MRFLSLFDPLEAAVEFLFGEADGDRSPVRADRDRGIFHHAASEVFELFRGVEPPALDRRFAGDLIQRAFAALAGGDAWVAAPLGEGGDRLFEQILGVGNGDVGGDRRDLGSALSRREVEADREQVVSSLLRRGDPLGIERDGKREQKRLRRDAPVAGQILFQFLEEQAFVGGVLIDDEQFPVGLKKQIGAEGVAYIAVGGDVRRERGNRGGVSGTFPTPGLATRTPDEAVSFAFARSERKRLLSSGAERGGSTGRAT